MLLLAAQRRHPVGHGPVLLGPRRSRDLAVGDIADEQVQEGVLALALDRRTPLAADELLARQRMQALLDGGPIAPVHLRDRPRPEDLAEDRGILQQRLLLRLEAVEPGGDDSLDGLRQRQLVSGAALGEHARELLGVERVPSRPREQGRLLFRGEEGLLEEHGEQARSFLVGERRERDRGGIRLPAAPGRPALEQLRPRGADTEQWNIRGPVHQVIDEVEQVVIRPVQVLEHEHCRALVRELLEEASPGIEASVRLSGSPSAPGRPTRGRAVIRPPCSARPGRDGKPRPRSFAAACSAGSVSRMPAWAFTISAAPSRSRRRRTAASGPAAR